MLPLFVRLSLSGCWKFWLAAVLTPPPSLSWNSNTISLINFYTLTTLKDNRLCYSTWGFVQVWSDFNNNNNKQESRCWPKHLLTICGKDGWRLIDWSIEITEIKWIEITVNTYNKIHAKSRLNICWHLSWWMHWKAKSNQINMENFTIPSTKCSNFQSTKQTINLTL